MRGVSRGRQVLKAIGDYYPETLEVVAFNDIGDMKTMAHLLKYDSTYGRFNGAVEVADDGLLIDGKKVKVFKETDPAAIPWKDLGLEVGHTVELSVAVQEHGLEVARYPSQRPAVLTVPGPDFEAGMWRV